MSASTILFGSYVRGLYTAALTHTGAVTDLTCAQAIAEPTYLDVTADHQVYAIQQAGERAGIASFQLTAARQLLPRATQLGWTPAPVHVNALTTAPFVLVSNYRAGNGQVYRRDATGTLTLTDQFQNMGHGVLPQQASSHVHYMTLTPDGRHLLVLDLGTDELMTFGFDPATGKLTDRQATLAFRPGFGPRHLVFNAAGTLAFVLGELASAVAVLTYDAATGFHQRQLISTLPDAWVGNNGGGGIHLSADGRFLYVSNRGHDSLIVYRVTPANATVLTPVQQVATHGEFPRDFCLSPDGRFLVVGNQKSNNATVFTVDQATGRLTVCQTNIAVSAPVCVKIVPTPAAPR